MRSYRRISVIPMLSMCFLATGWTLSSYAETENSTPPGNPPPSVQTTPGSTASSSQAKPLEKTPGVTIADPSIVPPKDGFAVGLFLGARTITANRDVSTSVGSSTFGGNIFLGYKVSRVYFGVFFELNHVSDSMGLLSDTKGDSSSFRTDTAFMVGPGTQITLVSTKDARVQLFALVRTLFGRTFSSVTNDPPLESTLSTEDDTNFRFSYQFAPGLRYRIHPQLAFVTVAGLSGDVYKYKQNTKDGMRGDIVNALGLFAAVGFMGVF